MKTYIFLFLLIPIFSYSKVLIGIESLISDQFHLIENKNIGIITNHTSVIPSGKHFVDHLFEMKKVNIVALFGPEHGIRGDIPDGSIINNSIDALTGITIYSLYGDIRKPTKDMLKGIDVLIFDIQDVGARFYTYISTLNNCIEAAAENNIKFIVCDRPNPIGGVKVAGPILKPNVKSFVGIQPIPVQHGMTVGELAMMFNDEGWFENNVKADLTVIKVRNWSRSQLFDQTGMNWINPSPNMVSSEAALIYPGLCLIEGTNVSEGRGTLKPFLTIGAPYIDSDRLIKELQQTDLKGVKFNSISFTPVAIKNMNANPKYKDKPCKGLKIQVTDPQEVEAVKLGITIIYLINSLHKSEFKFDTTRFNRLMGDDSIIDKILAGKTPEDILGSWESELTNFIKIREKYLFYN